MIVNIRGTSGSGKSTLVRNLMNILGGWRNLRTGHCVGSPNKAEYIESNNVLPLEGGKLYAVGDYSAQCGGCDGIKTQDEVCRRVRYLDYFGSPHTLFEGILISSIYERYSTLLKDLGGVTAFLDTPLEVCIEHVRKRRVASGVPADFDVANTTNKWHLCRKISDKLIADGSKVVWLPWQTADIALLQLLGESTLAQELSQKRY